MQKEFIREVPVCVCKNTPDDEGFQPCDFKGIRLEEAIDGHGAFFSCKRCGRIIEDETLAVVGFLDLKKEFIAYEAGVRDAWICVCRNRPAQGGFYPCDKYGNQVEPDENWIESLYVCDDCGRIINGETLEIVGRKTESKKTVL